MSSACEKNRTSRIAKNTLFLYLRMFFTMLIGLYTSRVVLENLGVENFGIYNVVGGVVALFATITGSLTAAIQRFLTFELGVNDLVRLRKVFSSSVFIQIALAIVVAFIAELLGLYFLNVKMNIPLDRLAAAKWVLHFSVVTFSINLVSVPYNAAIIAHERMTAFAYIGVFEALMKLGIAFAISVSPIDYLVFYAALMCLLAVFARFVYGIYCKHSFDECSIQFNSFDGKILKEIFGFAGWNFIGAASAILRDQGGNILLNLFFGPIVNAARGVATQVNNAVTQFVTGFTTALNPQITKSFANGDRDFMMKLIFWGSRLSFYMLMLVSLPILLSTNFLLTIWLKNVPDQTVLFVQLIILFSLSESISCSLITAMLATGKIRNYQLIVGGLQMLNFPVSYLLLKLDYPAISVLIVAIFISQCCFFSRVVMLKKMIFLPVKKFLWNVYFNVICVAVVAFVIPYCLRIVMNDGMFDFVIISCCSILWSIFCVLFLGCSKTERIIILTKIRERIKHA